MFAIKESSIKSGSVYKLKCLIQKVRVQGLRSTKIGSPASIGGMTNFRASVTQKSDFMDKHYLEPVYKVRVWIRMFAIKACEVEKSRVYWGNRAFFRRA